jgi:flavodoxin
MMRVLVTAATQYGATTEIAQAIAEVLITFPGNSRG